MAGFAPSYYHENNNAWLNDLVGDIINPNDRPRGRSHSREQVDSFVVDDDDDVVPDFQDHSTTNRDSPLGWRQKTSPPPRHQKSPTFHHSRRSSSLNSHAHYSYRNSVSRASRASAAHSSTASDAAQNNMYFKTISEDNDTLSLDPYHRRSNAYSPDLDRESPTVRGTPLSEVALNPVIEPSGALSRSDSISPVYYYPKRHSSHQDNDALGLVGDVHSHRANHGLKTPSEIGTIGSRENGATSRQSRRSRSELTSRTSLGRTLSEKRRTDCPKPTLSRIYSDTTEVFGGFAPHPAVRPLNDREKLGEAAGPVEEDDHVYPGPFALALIIVGICLSVFIISVDRNIVTTAIPQITATFKSYDDIGWYGSAYFLTASAFQPLYGRVYMSFDTRWTFLAAVAIFELGSLLAGVSPNSPVLILGRAIQGFGSAGILTGSFVVGTHSVPLRGRPVLFAFVGILYGVGALAGPLLGGIFTDLLSWRWAFYINLPVGAVTFVAVFFFFKPRKNKKQTERQSWISRVLQLDLIGNAILLSACVMLFLALQLSETQGNWHNAPVIGLLCGFGVLLLIFIAWLIYRGDKALIPPRIICQRTVAASCGVAFFIYAGLLIHAYYLPIWFQAIKGDSAIESGVNMIPYMLANALFSLIAGIFVSKNGLFAPPAIIGNAIGAIGSGFLATFNANTSTGKWIGIEILISAGLGLAIQQGFSAVQTALPLEEVPIGTAAVVASQSLGGAIFVSIGNTILQDHLLNQNADQAIPGVDLRAVFQLGATMFRTVVPEESLPAVIQLYNESLQGVFIASVPLIGCAFLCALCMEWRSVKTKQELVRKKNESEKA